MNKKVLKVNVILILIVMLFSLSGCSFKTSKIEVKEQEQEQEQEQKREQQKQKNEDKIEYKSYMLSVGSSVIFIKEDKIIVSSYEQLTQILNQNKTEQKISVMLKENLGKYDEEYFKTKSLALVVASATAGYNIKLDETIKDSDNLKVKYTVKNSTTEGMNYITVMYNNLIVVEIDKDIKDIVVDVNY